MISEFGSTRNPLTLGDRIFNRTYDDFALSQNSIDREANRICLFTNDQNVKSFAALIINLKHTGQP